MSWWLESINREVPTDPSSTIGNSVTENVYLGFALHLGLALNGSLLFVCQQWYNHQFPMKFISHNRGRRSSRSMAGHCSTFVLMIVIRVGFLCTPVNDAAGSGSLFLRPFINKSTVNLIEQLTSSDQPIILLLLFFQSQHNCNNYAGLHNKMGHGAFAILQ